MKPIHEVIKHNQTAADDRREWTGAKALDNAVAAYAARSPTGSIFDPRKPVKFGKKAVR